MIRMMPLLALWLPTVMANPVLHGQFHGLEFGASLTSVKAKIDDLCQNLEVVEVDPPSFPLAATTEQQLICRNLSAGHGTMQHVALTFADDALLLIYATGGAARALMPLASEPLASYLHFSASFKDLLVVDEDEDQGWVMSPQSAHPNLFQWPNPYIGKSRPRYSASAEVPEVLRFGGELETLKPLYDERCEFSSLNTYRVWLLTQPDLQQQIDCFGIEFAGFPRKIEAVFGDGILEQAWILTGKGEEDRVRRALVAAYGEPIHVDAVWEVFDENRVMLRKDKPEVLMLSDRLAPIYRREVVDAR